MTTYPAEKYLLDIWNHGGGWRDPDENEELNDIRKPICWDDESDVGGQHDTLYMNEVQQAIKNALSSAGKAKIDIIYMDACLMQMVEVAYEMKNYCTYLVASEETVPGIGVALSIYTETPANIDGDLSEYGLSYGSEIMNPETATNNNVVSWGTAWDQDFMYIGVQIVDAVVEWNSEGSPWMNDAIEFYIDGNNDKDGPYDAEFDSQLIMDVNEATGLWIKADGFQMDSTQYEAIFVLTDNGYNIEMKVMWNAFQFSPGRNRTIGFSLGNNDSDNLSSDRDYQTLWFGDGNNWSDTKILGEMQLANGPYFFVTGFDEDVLYNANIMLYPNPTNGNANLQSIDNVFNGEVDIFIADITGRIVVQTRENMSNLNTVQLRTANLNRGIYFVNVLGQDGKRAVKKLIIN